MGNLFIGIDNGVSGSIGILSYGLEEIHFFPTPTVKEQSYTKTKKGISRINYPALKRLLRPYMIGMALLERPMVNPGRFNATASALRALEATLIALEVLKIPRCYVDSKEWQKVLLPHGCKGDDLKKASRDIGCRMFPSLAEAIIKHKDADGILIAEFCRRRYAVGGFK